MKKKSIIYDDLYRYTGQRTLILLLRYILFTPGFRYVFLFRKTSTANSLLSKIFWKIFLRQCMLRTGIQIPESTKIDVGFRIIHFGQIVIHPATIIGKNFNISQGVTLGHAEGAKVGSPKIGNNVSIGPNAVVVGGVVIGDDVLIAPNAFVNFDVPNGAIVLGNPGKIIQKEKGSAKYIIYKID
jgi:serine O-acetyltransferase